MTCEWRRHQREFWGIDDVCWAVAEHTLRYEDGSEYELCDDCYASIQDKMDETEPEPETENEQ